MKTGKLMLLVLFIFPFYICAQNALSENGITRNDVGPNKRSEIYSPEIEAIWDVLLQFDATSLNGSTGNAGAEWNGTYFYSTRWQSNLIHEYNATGSTLIREFSIPGVTGLRDLAFDGSHFYGGVADNRIFEMDFTAGTLINTITTTLPVRHISYDSDQDAFWVGNWDTDIVAFDRSGNELARIPAGTHGAVNMYGSCYDNNSSGGPYLWVFSQGTGAGSPQNIIQLQLPGGTPTGVSHNVITDVGSGNTDAIAGGLFSMTDFASGFFTIGGILQGAPIADLMFVYEIGSTSSVENLGEMPNTYYLQQNYPNPFNPNTNIQFAIPQSSFVQLEVFNALGEKIDVLVSEQLSAGTYNFDWIAEGMTSGIYFYKLQTNGFVEAKKMILMK